MDEACRSFNKFSTVVQQNGFGAFSYPKYY